MDIWQQAVVDAQEELYNHLLGPDNWSEADFSLSLDAPVTGSDQWTTATTNHAGLTLAFHVRVFVDLDLETDHGDLAQEALDFIDQHTCRAGVAFGQAFGPGGGAAPIGFGGYLYRFTDDTGQETSRLLLTQVVTPEKLDSLELWNTTYENSLATYGVLGGEQEPPQTIAVVEYCYGSDTPSDAEFESCIVQAELNFQCQTRKLRSRVRKALGGGLILAGTCLFFPPSCLPSAGLLLGATYCLSVAKDDTLIDREFAIACCCSALDCRAGGGSGCQTVGGCNPSGRSVPLCGR